jgi:hypothetical protein
LSLISTASAVTAAPFPDNTFPRYATATTPTGATNIDSSDNILPAYFDSASKGPYRGFRNDLYVFPTQSITAASSTDATVKQTLAAQSTTRTFWQTTIALLGTYPANPATLGVSTAGAT